MTLSDKIQEARQELLLNSLLATNNMMKGAVDDEEFLSSGLVSASASLLKISADSVGVQDTGMDLSARLQDLIKDKDSEKNG